METKKKRSGGIAFWTWTFIITNLIGLFMAPGMMGMYTFLSRKVLGLLVLYGVLSSICGMLAGINLLRLKEWSRRLVLALVILGFFQAIIFVPFNHRYAQNVASQPNAIAIFEKQYDSLPPDTRAKINMTKEQFVEQVARLNGKVVGGIMGFFEVLLALYLFVLLWFFTKLETKRQFG